jgi:hypothetical protein
MNHSDLPPRFVCALIAERIATEIATTGQHNK